ncbi:hypothetical protein [Streptomyces sp. NPDC058612]|uniref:hypothetical protein n=1 Tax=Streptomyces sp. NPDC058612 TaxID=3346555 RepID=UPI003650AC12
MAAAADAADGAPDTDTSGTGAPDPGAPDPGAPGTVAPDSNPGTDVVRAVGRMV